MKLTDMTKEDVDALLNYQNHLCGLCQMPLKSLEYDKIKSKVDYDRGTFEVRGILCLRCFNGNRSHLKKFLSSLYNYLANPPASRILPKHRLSQRTAQNQVWLNCD